MGADGSSTPPIPTGPAALRQAEATREGKLIKLSFELRAGGYSGSTYTLSYNPAKDTLEGVYYQAVAQQKFDVHFARAKPLAQSKGEVDGN